MKGDFTRNTFDPAKHFTRVLMQQGRVQLDADWNEQVAILLHYLQTLAADLIGPHGGPTNPDGTAGDGFKISLKDKENKALENDFAILKGHYYVDGILCENEGKENADGNEVFVTYYTQPDYPQDKKEDKLPSLPYLAYLDVWERHVTYIEDDGIREVALRGPDTATRAQAVWQVKVTDKQPNDTAIPTTLGDVKETKETEEAAEAAEAATAVADAARAAAAAQGASAKSVAKAAIAVADAFVAQAGTSPFAKTAANRMADAARAAAVAEGATPQSVAQAAATAAQVIIGAVTANDWHIWVDTRWPAWVKKWQPKQRGQLKAKAIEDTTKETEACAISPDARYRRAENQLYRVEIHTGSQDRSGKATQPTFKWSRDNGSVTFPIRKLEGEVAYLNNLGRDDRLSLKEHDWVEVVDDNTALNGEAGPLTRVDKVDLLDMSVTLKAPGVTLMPYPEKSPYHPLLRRWDHKPDDPDKYKGALVIFEGKDDEKWIDLEDGIRIQFQEPKQGTSYYRTGDYWLIPARTATGDVEWPGEVGKPDPLPPHGVEHHYAPLAIISATGDPTDLRRKIEALGKPVP